MGWLPMVLEIIQRVPLFVYTGVGGLIVGGTIGYKLGSLLAVLRQRAFGDVLEWLKAQKGKDE